MNVKLLYKYVSGDVTPQERIQVVEWLYADEANMQQYVELRKLYDASVWIEDSHDTNRFAATKISKRKRIVLQFSKIAAAVILLFVATYTGYRQNRSTTLKKDQMLTMIVPGGQYGQLILPDGSRVWLNSQSRLEFPSKFDSDCREVFLYGEGFFDVVADKTSPFVVHTKNYAVRALGTTFNICSFDDDESSSTSLLTGIVDIELNHSKEKFNLRPNQQFEYKNGDFSLKPLSEFDYFEWRNGFLSFKNESMKDILDKLSRCYAIRFEIENKSILTDEYTGKFQIKGGVEHALKVLQLRSDFSYQHEGNSIIIGKGKEEKHK